MIKAIIVDDEWAAGQWIALQLEEIGGVEIAEIFQDPRLLYQRLKLSDIDVVFLDISMPELTGMEIATQLMSIENPPEVVFVTAHDSFAIEAFKVNALDYIVKPAHSSDLIRILAKVSQQRLLKGNKYKTMVKSADLSHFIMFDPNDFVTSKCEELYYYLLLSDKQRSLKWTIIDNLWPDVSVDRGKANIRTTVFRLNQTFEEKALNLRVRAIKENYCFVDVNDPKSQIHISLYPKIEGVENRQAENILELVMKCNLIERVQSGGYLWMPNTIKVELDYIEWALRTIELIKDNDDIQVKALIYLIEKFPWNSDLMVKMMPIIKKVKGQGVAKRFYEQYIEYIEEMQDSEMAVLSEELLKALKF